MLPTRSKLIDHCTSTSQATTSRQVCATVLRKLPAAIRKQVSSMSCDGAPFLTLHQCMRKLWLRWAGQLKYVDPQEHVQHKNRGRLVWQHGITWFNPPYSKSISTNVRKRFLTIVQKHFGKNSNSPIVLQREYLEGQL